MKHAFLIIAHNEFDLLQVLVNGIDDPRNDIYIHFDAKIPVLPAIRARESKIKVLEKRIDVRWGDFSQIETELALFESASSAGTDYAYYHLISGVDLPLKHPDSFHLFFEENKGKEFIGYGLTEMTPELVRKVQRWHLFPKHFRDASILQGGLRSGFLLLQEAMGIKRNRKIAFKKGANWVSVTGEMVRYVLSKEAWIRRVFRHTFCGDEVFLQTLCWQSPFKDRIFDTSDEWKGNLRLIGWKDGALHDWTSDDYDSLANSDALFARKFNSTDMDFIHRVEALSKR